MVCVIKKTGVILKSRSSAAAARSISDVMDIDLLHGVSETFGFCLVHSHPIVNHTEIDLAAAAKREWAV